MSVISDAVQTKDSLQVSDLDRAQLSVQKTDDQAPAVPSEELMTIFKLMVLEKDNLDRRVQCSKRPQCVPTALSKAWLPKPRGAASAVGAG